jgi:tripartite-type tricarboxylate transporter receptor subunit TctC
MGEVRVFYDVSGATVRETSVRPFSTLAFAAALAGATVGAAAINPAMAADAYPSKPGRILVGFAPGSIIDLVARYYAKSFQEAWGQTFIVENRPGASGNIATQVVAQANPDGHTLLFTSIGHALNASLFPSLRFDPVKSFAPVGTVAFAANAISVNPSSPIRSFGDLVTYAKAHPGELTHATPGVGTLMHIGMELLEDKMGIKLLHVPFSGSGPALQAVLSAQVQVVSAGLGSTKAFADTGQIRMLAVSTPTTSPLAPNLPTVAEAAGLPDYQAVGWLGLLAPAGTPKEVVDKLNAQILKVQQSPEMLAWLANQGVQPYYTSPDEFGAVIQADMEKWGKVIRENGIKDK